MNPITLLFPGQGVQHVGMIEEIKERFPLVPQFVMAASEIIGENLEMLCISDEQHLMNRTDIVQPLILSISVGIYESMKRKTNLHVDYLAGHSLGEYSALVCAGAIAFDDAVTLVRMRGQFMHDVSEKNQGGMLAINGLSLNEVRKLLNEIEGVFIACDNSKHSCVASGALSGLSTLQQKVVQKTGAKATRLYVEGAFHSALMNEAAEKFADSLSACNIQVPKCQVFSNFSSLPYKTVDEIKRNLVKQISNTVLWTDTIQALHKHKSRFLDVGPKSILKNMMMVGENGIPCLSLIDDYEAVISLFEDYEDYGKPRDFISFCLREAVCTRNKRNNKMRYSEINAAYAELCMLAGKEEESNYNNDDKVKAVNCMMSIYEAKGYLKEDIKERIIQMAGLNQTVLISAFFQGGDLA